MARDLKRGFDLNSSMTHQVVPGARRWPTLRRRPASTPARCWAGSSAPEKAEKAESFRVKQEDPSSVKQLAVRIHQKRAQGVSNIAPIKWRFKRSSPEQLPNRMTQPAKQIADTSKAVPLQQLPFSGAHKPLGLVAISAHILGTACQLSGSHVAAVAASTHSAGGCVLLLPFSYTTSKATALHVQLHPFAVPGALTEATSPPPRLAPLASQSKG